MTGDKKYRINEIFYSLQGEGFFTGTPAVFIRFSGCNLACPFCDTDHLSHSLMSSEEITDILERYPATHVVLTGGEPALQVDDHLVTRLKSLGYFLQIETNGTMKLPGGIDWVTCSPKDGGKVALDRVDEMKIVYQGQDVETIAKSLPPASHYFLQPLSCSNTAQVVDYLLSHPRWRLSLQTHKLIDIK